MDSLLFQVSCLVWDLFIRNGNPASLDPDMDLLQNGICDSLGFLTISMKLEERFPGLKVMDQEIDPSNFGSIRKITQFLATKGFSA